MDLLQLRYFQAVAKSEHMSRAAEELHISQPSLSKAISRLEEDLGVDLFDREGRQIKLNRFGKAFLPRVDAAFAELDAARRDLAELSGQMESTVSVALNIQSLLPSLLDFFLKKNPGITVRHEIGSTSEMRQLLEEGSVDFCISSPLIEGERFVCSQLFTEELYLFVPREHRLAGRLSLSLSEVSGDPFVAFKRGYGIRDLTEELCRQAGFEPRIAFEGDITSALIELVSIGMGVALLPPPHKWNDPGQQLHGKSCVALRIENPLCVRSIGLSYTKGKNLSPISRRFMAAVQSFFRSFQNQ
jgi:DNA-binding transcriptional LysR family regulator